MEEYSMGGKGSGRRTGAKNKIGRPKCSTNKIKDKSIDDSPDVLVLKIMLIIDDFFPLEKALSSTEINSLERSILKTLRNR